MMPRKFVRQSGLEIIEILSYKSLLIISSIKSSVTRGQKANSAFCIGTEL